MSEFLHMGGYAFYVWTSYGLALAILLWQFLAPLRMHRQLLARLRRKYRQSPQAGNKS